MIISKRLLDDLSEQAKRNTRLRQSPDSRNSQEDKFQRMQNALEPGTIMTIHRHHARPKTVILLRGRVRWFFFVEEGKEAVSVVLDANRGTRLLYMEKDRWHSLECLESAALLESKDEACRSLE